MTSLEALHSSESNEHYTPPDVIEASRAVLGSITLDPASCELANTHVKATTYISLPSDGLVVDWWGNVFLNPPGGKVGRESSMKIWWNKLCIEYAEHRVNSAVFIAFSMEFLQKAQEGTRMSPWQFPICVPKKRLAFWLEKDGKLVASTQPTHANAIIFLPPVKDGRDEACLRFEKEFRSIGQCVSPQR